MGTGKTRIDTASNLGIDFEVIPRLSIREGIEKGRTFWKRLWVNEETCPKWVDAISQYCYEYDEMKKSFGMTPIHNWTSHAADVHRYAAVVEDQMLNEDESLRDVPSDPIIDDSYVGNIPYEDGGDGDYENKRHPI